MPSKVRYGMRLGAFVRVALRGQRVRRNRYVAGTGGSVTTSLALCVALVLGAGSPASGGDIPAGTTTVPSVAITRAFPIDGGFSISWSGTASSLVSGGYVVATARYSDTKRTWTPWTLHEVGAAVSGVTFRVSNGVQVRVKVRAIADSSVGPWSSSRWLYVGAPKSPTNTRASVNGSIVTISWNPASDNGFPVTWQYVRWREARYGGSFSYGFGAWNPASDHKWVATGWTPGRLYEVYVYAKNANGTGPRGSLIRVRPAS